MTISVKKNWNSLEVFKFWTKTEIVILKTELKPNWKMKNAFCTSAVSDG